MPDEPLSPDPITPDPPAPELPDALSTVPPIDGPAAHQAARAEIARIRGLASPTPDDEARLGALEGVVEVYEEVHPEAAQNEDQS